MKNSELRDFIAGKLADVLKLFDRKNEAYGKRKYAFWNFKQGADVLYGCSLPWAMFSTAYAWATKHWVTLKKGLELDEDDIEERLLDVILYCLIMLAIIDEHKKTVEAVKQMFDRVSSQEKVVVNDGNE